MSTQEIQRLQMEQRGGFQFRLIELNLIGAGVFVSFALSSPGHWDSLLVFPLLSFLLFTFWLHHALAIRLTCWYSPPPITIWEIARCASFAIGILGTFVLLPIACLWLHARGPEQVPKGAMRSASLYVFPIIILVTFALWVYLNYWKRTPPKGAIVVE